MAESDFFVSSVNVVWGDNPEVAIAGQFCPACGMIHQGAGGVSGPPSEGQGTAQPINSPQQNINGLLSAFKWDSLALTFNFVGPGTVFPQDYGVEPTLANFATLSGAMQNMTIRALADVASVSNLTFTQIANGGLADISSGLADISNMTAYAYYPGGNFNAGDAWYRSTGGQYLNPIRGNISWLGVIHEIGHTLGLKHGHEPDTINNPIVMNGARDSLEFSLMTYRSYIGGPFVGGFSTEEFGYPQTLMMYDIAALQLMYGANFNTNNGVTIYTWNVNTGEMSIGGVGQGAVGANRIFATIWDGGGTDTYDLSNYTTNLQIDLTPGSWSKFSDDQTADLGNGNRARANIFNAEQFNGDLRSLIENATGGSGNDVIVGNGIGNVLTGGSGNDAIASGAGTDTLDGGAGADTLAGGTGDDAYVIDDLGDVLAELANEGVDTVFSSVSYIMGANFEHVTLSGVGNDGVLGNELNNIIRGNSGNNGMTGGFGNDQLFGNLGSDVLDGGFGSDYMEGGAGIDTYFVDSLGDVVAEIAETGVYDTIWTTVNLVLPANTEILIVNGAGAANGIGNDDLTLMLGNPGANGLYGLGGNDVILGQGGVDTIDGGTGNDVISGGAGADFLTSGTGNDLFVYASINEAGDLITDFNTTAGTNLDLLDLRPMFTTFTAGYGTTAASAIAAGYLSVTQVGLDASVQVAATGGGALVLLSLLQNANAAAVTNCILVA
ncbi:MAG: M10 family metallopeptidase C-terminal domain-containing protein [Bosea sp. (in: a-proteobacteria)]